MVTILEKNYEIVSKKNKTFQDIFEPAWKENNIAYDIHTNSDYLLVKNNKAVIIGTIEMVNYNQGNEHKDVESYFDFKRFQREDIQLFYVDKLCITPSQRGSIKNMHYMISSLVTYSNEHCNGKPFMICAAIRKRFFRYLSLVATGTITQVGEERDGEIPVLIDFSDQLNKKANESNSWVHLH